MMMSNAARELRLAARGLSRKPGFSAVVVGTVALAIAASTVIYSIVHAVVLAPLPYAAPDRLVGVWQVGAKGGHGQFSDPNFEDLRDQSRAFKSIAEYADYTTTVVVGTTPVRAGLAVVSRQFFETLGTPPLRGRTFAPEELRVGTAPVAIVSYGFWQRAMSGGSLEQPVRIDGQLTAVVGVMPPRFDFPAGSDVWTPREQEERNPHRTGHNFMLVARLADGLTLNAARADASTVARRLKAALGSETAMVDTALVPLQEQIAGTSRGPLLMLLASVGCLVLIACANLANLMLAHVTGRRRELAVRSALGAGRAALALPLLAEIALLCGLGGVLGIALATGGLQAIVALLPIDLPRRTDIGVSWPVVGAALGLTAITGTLLGAAVAWSAVRSDVVDWLKQGQRGQTGSAGTGRLRNALVVVQLAVSLVLLVGAGLLGRSLAMLLAQQMGFRTDQVLTIDLSGPSGRTPEILTQRVQFHQRLIEQLAALPGVESVGGVSSFPLGDGYANGTYVKGVGAEVPVALDDLGALYRDPAAHRARRSTGSRRRATSGRWASRSSRVDSSATGTTSRRRMSRW